MKAEEYESTEVIFKNAIKWILCGGTFALCLLAFLITSDIKLVNSTYDKDLNVKLKAVRVSQAGVAAPLEDARQAEKNR